MKSVLIIEDDERLLSLLIELLKSNNFEAVGTKSAAEARSLLKSKAYDVLVIDWMLPRETGIEFIKSIRESSYLKNIPAIMLTAVDGIDNKIIGFEAGFDDYLTKPFEEKELIARLNALLKRSYKKNDNTIVKFGTCIFNLETEKLVKNDEIIHLSTTELTLLKTLCQSPNYPHSRSELARKLTFQVSDRTIDVQITRLRKKIGDTSKTAKIIKTVRYIGYSISVNLD